jgi:hypothetical protein
MAITGHKTFTVFQRYNNPSEEDLREVVNGAPQAGRITLVSNHDQTDLPRMRSMG